jgi:hypothetical protein
LRAAGTQVWIGGEDLQSAPRHQDEKDGVAPMYYPDRQGLLAASLESWIVRFGHGSYQTS